MEHDPMDRDALNAQPGVAALIQIVNSPAPTTIEGVVARMQAIDNILPPSDGLKWFNKLYLLVTQGVLNMPPEGGWQRPGWLARLDVIFANRYFGAVARWHAHGPPAPRAWQALFEARYRPGIVRVQFALAGMNAHINHDLALAVVDTCAELATSPRLGGPEHGDFERVNEILAHVEPQAMQYLATGIIGEVAQSLGDLSHLMAMWSVRTARDTAWNNSMVVWGMRQMPMVGTELRDQFLLGLDRMTGLAGRGMVLPM
jgi:hypothetical protein